MTYSRTIWSQFSLAFAALVVVFLGALAQPAVAQEAEGEQPSGEQVTVVEFKANAGADKNVVAGRTVLFDASATAAPEDAEVTYTWDFGDGITGEGIDATHAYGESGIYRVGLTARIAAVLNEDGSVRSEGQESTSELIVSVQDRIALLVTDKSVPLEEVEALQEYALTQGTLLVSVRATGVDQDFQTTTNLASQLLERRDDLTSAEMILTWTTGNEGLTSFIELSRIAGLSEIDLDEFGFASKAIVSVANNQTLASSAVTAATTFTGLQPSYIVVGEEEILNAAVRADSIEDFQRDLTSLAADYQIITEYTVRAVQKLSPLNFMSRAVTYMINKGVPVNTVFLILMLPIMATIIAAARQLVGIKAFGIFAPTVIALSFLATGLKYGITIFLAIIIIGGVARSFARRFRLLYLPRMALVLSMLAFAVFGMFFVGALTDRTGFIAVSVFPILIMTVLTEHFVSVQIQQGYKAALKLTLETLALSILGYVIGDWTVFKTTILAYPELVLLTILFNYLMGKYTGLRLMEYVRFRKVFSHMGDAEK